MARKVSSSDVEKTIKKIDAQKEELRKIATINSTLNDNIKRAGDTIVAEELLGILRGIPVEELSNHLERVRVKSLREYGYNDFSDLYLADMYSLSSVYGISENTAFAIVRLVRSNAKEIMKTIKVKISTDNKTRQITELVLAIAIYKRMQYLIKLCRKQAKYKDTDIELAKVDIEPLYKKIGWLFVPKDKKESAIKAYELLNEIAEGEFFLTAQGLLDSAEDILSLSDDEAWRDFAKEPIEFFNIIEKKLPGLLGTDDTTYGLPDDLIREIQDECIFPDGLLCTLRRYQEWGVKYILHQKKVLLGDEMGLGKTIQAIATMVSLKNIGATHFLVVCPASVLTNWCKEIGKHSRLKHIKIHGSQKKYAFKSWIRNGGVGVTTYETLSAFDLEDDFFFNLLIVDEAHYAKNPGAKRSANVRFFASHAHRLLFMTGTALENNVNEMVSLIDILNPRIAEMVRNQNTLTQAPQFRKDIAPVYYRRKREDVLTELPELIEIKEWVQLGNIEKEAYETAVLNKRYADARRVSWIMDNMAFSSKAQRLKEIVEQAKGEDRKVIVFSFFLDTIRKVAMLFEDDCINIINGGVNPQKRQEIIDDFEKAPSGSVLALQIQSGGTGLNIQSASVVVICEPQFKPSIENQAISRAYRMGQTRNVIVHRLLCEDTIDERISEILENKQMIFDAFADESEAAKSQEKGEIDDKKFGEIINEEIERIKKEREAGLKDEEGQ